MVNGAGALDSWGFAAIISTLQISAQTNNNQNISDLNYSQIQTNFENSKISPELQQIINESPDEIVLVTILLKEQPIHNIAQKKKDKYKSKLYEFQDKVQSQFKGSRKNVLAKKSTDINAYGSVKFDDETSIDITSPLTETEKQNILETNSKFEKARQEMIQEIADLPEIDYVEKTQISKPDMDTSTYSIYANTFWNNGLFGTPFEVGIADTGVDSSHPALSSRVIASRDFVPGDSDGNNPDDLNGHGTHVSGTVASTDSVYKGVANGANIINLKIGNSNVGYSAYDSDVMAGVDWAIIGTADPAEIISHSYGGTTSKSRFFDAVVDDLGLTVSVSAGNSGPNPNTVSYDSYNSIVVGGMNDIDTGSRTDDIIYYYSSRGPVPGTARIKHDIMAPGEYITSAAHNWETGSDFVTFSGTSMAAPHISGAAALLMSAGVYEPKEIKALLINGAEDKGTTGEDYDYGWGYVDLNHTFFHTPDVRTGVVNNSDRYLLYKGYAFNGDKASLVWNRHVNYSGALPPSIYYSLSDLNLYMYNESDGTLFSYSNSSDENVEQVISNSNTNTILKIKANIFASGITSEEFALALEEGFTEVNPPILNVNVINPGSVISEDNFNLDVIVTNNGGIAAHGVSVTISLPSGFSIVSGANPQSLGSINAGNSKTASWVVKVPTVSISTSYSLGASASLSSFGESYSGSGSSSITINPTPYTVPPYDFISKIPSYVQWHFLWPSAVAVDSSGNVYVADGEYRSIQKFNSSGILLAKWGSSGNGDGQFNWASGIAVDSDGNVYVADWNDRIQKFSSTGAFLTKWGSSGSGDGQFFRPEGIAVDGSGNVYVADLGNDRIQKFSSTGTFLAKWGSSGSGNSQFSSPNGVAVDSGSNVYVADDNGRIQKFSSSGTFLAKWGSLGSGDGQFSSPSGVAVDSGGNVYVADYGNHRIQKFSSTGGFLTKWGSSGSGNGQFSSPRGVAVDSGGNVYVADTYNNRVQKFSSTGGFLTKWGSSGSGNGQFSSPRGVAVDSGSNVYVADTGNDRIQKFSSMGAFLTKWGSFGSDDGQFFHPNGVAVDSGGNVYVADYGNHRIQKFSSSGTFLAKWGSYGIGNGQFNEPFGIAVDSGGNVYITEAVNDFEHSNDRIQKFSSSGTFLAKWGSFGSDDGQFYDPNGVAVDSGGNVYVTDTYNNRVQKFRYLSPRSYTFQTTNNALQITVDGALYPSPKTVTWADGSTHSVSVPSTQAIISGQSQYAFTSWSGMSASASPSISITAGVSTAGTYNANYNTQYYLTVNTDPAGLTSISGSGWYNSGTSANTGTALSTVSTYTFSTWKVDGSQVSGNPISLNMNTQHTATAVYLPNTPILTGTISGTVRRG